MAPPITGDPEVPATGGPTATVGVREPRRAAPKGSESAAGVRGQWQIPLPPYAVDTPIPGVPQPALKPRPWPTREDWELPANIPAQASDAKETIQESIDEIPQGWQPSKVDWAVLDQEVPWVQNRGNPVHQAMEVAEETAARGTQQGQVDAEAFNFMDLVKNPPGWLVGVPAIRAAQMVAQRAVAAGWGTVGRGPAALVPGTTGVNQSPHKSVPTGHAPRRPVAGARPIRSTISAGGVSGGGKHVDARGLLQGMITNATRRTFSAARRQRSEL